MDGGERQRLLALHAEAVANYRAGCRTPEAVVSEEGLRFLCACGLDPQCLYDYADDAVRYGEPPAETFAEVAEIRAAQFREVFGGKIAASSHEESELPRKADEFDGVPWLPRIIRKAQYFLEGRMPGDIMYGCSGDRAFLKKFGATLPGFLRLVRETGGDPEAVLAAIRKV
jgi:hypothetical protein